MDFSQKKTQVPSPKEVEQEVREEILSQYPTEAAMLRETEGNLIDAAHYRRLAAERSARSREKLDALRNQQRAFLDEAAIARRRAVSQDERMQLADKFMEAGDSHAAREIRDHVARELWMRRRYFE
jgi:hypothetical protein